MLAGFPAGNNDVSSAPWRGWFSQLRNRINVPPICEATNTNFTLVSPGAQKCPLDTVTINVNVPFTNGTFTVPISGIYFIAYSVDFTAPAPGTAVTIGSYIKKNGLQLTQPSLAKFFTASAGADLEYTSVYGYASLNLIRGDTLELYVNSQTASNIAVAGSSMSVKFVQ